MLNWLTAKLSDVEETYWVAFQVSYFPAPSADQLFAICQSLSSIDRPQQLFWQDHRNIYRRMGMLFFKRISYLQNHDGRLEAVMDSQGVHKWLYYAGKRTLPSVETSRFWNWRTDPENGRKREQEKEAQKNKEQINYYGFSFIWLQSTFAFGKHSVEMSCQNLILM